MAIDDKWYQEHKKKYGPLKLPSRKRPPKEPDPVFKCDPTWYKELKAKLDARDGPKKEEPEEPERPKGHLFFMIQKPLEPLKYGDATPRTWPIPWWVRILRWLNEIKR